MSPTHDLGIWLAALLTLFVFSFLYKDNPLYKFAEHLFVGVSAGYYIVLNFWTVVIPNLWDPLVRIFDAFGLQRCLWGTDWTRAIKVVSYRDGVEAFRVTDRLSDSDKAMLMGEALTRVYKWAPSPA